MSRFSVFDNFIQMILRLLSMMDGFPDYACFRPLSVGGGQIGAERFSIQLNRNSKTPGSSTMRMKVRLRREKIRRHQFLKVPRLAPAHDGYICDKALSTQENHDVRKRDTA
jgi:hypothetical protein